MTDFLMLGSIALGLAAWTLPVIGSVRPEKAVLFAGISTAACAISLLFQMFYFDQMVRQQAWDTLTDTTSGSVTGAAVMLGMALVLNVIALLRRKQQPE